MNLAFTFVAIWLVDRPSRKSLLVVGSVVQIAALAACGVPLPVWRRYAPGCAMRFIATFASALGPVPWILISKIFPNRIRGHAVNITTFMLACVAVSETFPWLQATIGPDWTF